MLWSLVRDAEDTLEEDPNACGEEGCIEPVERYCETHSCDSAISEIEETFDPMTLYTVCNQLTMLCVVAGADMHIDGVNNAPNVATHVTSGGGHNGNLVFDAYVTVETTLGDESDTFAPGTGEIWTWTDVATGGCKYEKLETRSQGTTLLPIPPVLPPGVADLWTPVEAHAKDEKCEKLGN